MAETTRFSDLPIAASMGNNDYLMGMAGGAPSRVPVDLLKGSGGATESWPISYGIMSIVDFEQGKAGSPFQFLRPMPDTGHASLVTVTPMTGHEFQFTMVQDADPMSVLMPGVGIGADLCIDAFALSQPSLVMWGPTFTVPAIPAGSPTASLIVCFKNQNSRWMDMLMASLGSGAMVNPFYMAGCSFVLQAGTDPYACAVGAEVIETMTSAFTMPDQATVQTTITIKPGDRVYVGIKPGTAQSNGTYTDSTLVVAVNDVTQPVTLMGMQRQYIPVGEGLRPYFLLGVMSGLGAQSNTYNGVIEASFSPDELTTVESLAANGPVAGGIRNVSMCAFSVPPPADFGPGKRYAVTSAAGGSVVAPFRGYIIRQDDVIEVLDDGELNISRVSPVPPPYTYAPTLSPAFSGIPTAPSPAAGDNSQQIATTQWVTQALPVAPVQSYSTFSLMEDTGGSTTLTGAATFYEDVDSTAINSAVLYLPQGRAVGSDIAVRIGPVVSMLTVKFAASGGDEVVAVTPITAGETLLFRAVPSGGALGWWLV